MVFWVLLNRTVTGYEVRAVGFNPDAARAAGISVSRNYILVMAICGLFAGLAASLDVLGWQFRVARNDIEISQIGFLGIAVALLGRNTAIGTFFSALLFGALLTGTSVRNLDPLVFPPELATALTSIIQGLIVLFVSADILVVYLWRLRRRIRRRGAGRVRGGGGMTRRQSAGRAVAAGFLAFFVAVPPFTVRTPALPIVLGLLGLFLGTWSIAGGEKRAAAGAAIAAAVVGMAGGIAATQSGVGNLERVVVWSALFAAMLRYATPLIFASLGGLFSERSGVINIALEGMLLTGAFFAVLGADLTGTWYLGVLIGMAAGGLLALIHAIFSVSLRADQIVSGTALNFLAFGLTTYLYLNRYGAEGTPTDLPQVPDVHLPLIEDIGFVGDIFGQLNLLIWMGLALVLVTWVVVFRTPPGLRLRAAGENPLAAETAGLSVVRTRYLAVVTSGVLAGAGGAYLSIGFVHSFSQNMTIGKGFIALAALIFGRWRPGGALMAALLFGFSTALAQRLPVFSPSAATLFQALPYVLTLVAVAGLVGRSIPPAAIGRPLERS